MSTVAIENVGPITSVTIPIPEDGGFVVLKGTHGVGKSTTIEAVSLPPDGLLTLSQAAFGELSPATRRDLDAALRQRKAVCLTAAVTDDPELYAEAFA